MTFPRAVDVRARTLQNCESLRPMTSAAAPSGAVSNASFPASTKLICCVCLDDLKDAVLHMLPCCGRMQSPTRCCQACLMRICKELGSCPHCRAPGLVWNGQTAVIMEEHGTIEPSLWRAVLLNMSAPLLRFVSAVVGIMLAPLDKAFEQALESVLSRGPV